MSESTIETIIIAVVMAVIITMYAIAEHQNYKLKKKVNDLTMGLTAYTALADLDRHVIHEMSEYVDHVHDKLAAANREIEELRKRTLAYNAETDSAELEVKSFDEHVDDALAIAAQATGGDFIREPEPQVAVTTQEIEDMLRVFGPDDTEAEVVPFKKAGH